LKKEIRRKILFVINPRAGSGQNTNYKTTILQFAKTEKFEYTIYKTTGENDGRQIQELLKTHQPERVIVFGGDGTINLVAAEMIDKSAILGIIPGGSANGLAHNLNIPTNFEEALKKILAETPYLWMLSG